MSRHHRAWVVRASDAAPRHRGERPLVRTRAGETLDDALHGLLGGRAVRGALVGAALLAAATVVVGLASGLAAATSAGLGAAVGLTGGPFFGSLAGFALGVQLVERLRAELGDDLERRDAVLVRVVDRPG